MTKPTKWTPHKYQKKAVRWLVQRPEAGLFLDPGLGKTSVTLAAFKAMRKAGGCHKALVVAPLRPCYMVWTHEEGGELHRWTDFHDLSIALLHGTKKDKVLQKDADIYVINFDGLQWLIDGGGLKELLARGVDTLVVDELSKLKHTRTKRFKRLKPWLKKFRRRWGLTGTPASNGLLDVFGQAYVLDLGKTLGRYITHFRHQYFYPGGYGGYTWRLQEGAEKKIYAALKPLVLSMRATDHLDLPDLVEQNIWVTLPDKARKAYDEMEKELITAIEQNVITAANAAVASGKCRQLASGGLYVEGATPRKRRVLEVHSAKTEALVELVDELQGSPILIAYEFHHDLGRISKALGDVPAINGKTTAKRCTELVRAWNAGELPILCGHPAAMGHGLNLQASGHHICWYSTTWDFELYDQLIRRVWRQGSKAKRVIVHRLLTRKTVDQAIISALRSKRAGQDGLMNALKRYAADKH